MGGQVSRSDFMWVYTQQPHVARRKIILEKYPQIKKLMGPDDRLKFISSLMVIFQLVSCYYISQLSYKWIILLAYCLGGIINHSLTLAIHETAHNMAFGNKYPLANRFFGMWLNLPIAVPYSIAFKKYHLEHHRFMGADVVDTDLPTKFEGLFFHNRPLKLLWVFLQPLFYALRPVIVNPKPPTGLEIINIIVQLCFDVILCYVCGIKGIVYFLGSTLLSTGLHPMAAHFIAEHYMFEKGYETYSYYGPWNLLTFNVGYHVEHHDFPYIPGSRLPEVKRIAAEFYDPLPQHESWLAVIWEFINQESNGPFARIKRDYEETYGKRKDSNPFLTIDTPQIYPTQKDLPLGERDKGRHVDWNNE